MLLLGGAGPHGDDGAQGRGASSRRGVLTAVMVVGLVDQQLNGANPRLYDFKGAFAHIEADAKEGDIVLYEPDYLAEVVALLRARTSRAESVGTDGARRTSRCGSSRPRRC